MFDFIRDHQMNIMLALCAACATMAIMLFFTRFLPTKRKWILILMELIATFLLFFDRMAYIYSGDVSRKAYILVRVSNFMVFFLTSGIVLGFNMYLCDLLLSEKAVEKLPVRLKTVSIMSLMGMMLVVISQFTGLIYSFDEQNKYFRGPGFLLCYIVPVICPLIQFTVICQYRKSFSRFINIAHALYIFVPIIVGIIQIFTYGLSIVNMSMVLVSISLYVFTYLDINDEVVRMHKIEMEGLKAERKSMRRLFDQTATAFVTAAEYKDPFSKGYSMRVAVVSKRLAKELGKNEEECNEIYYAALLHDVGKVALPDDVIGKTDYLTAEEEEMIKQSPAISEEILSNINEYPYLGEAARYSNERYDGTGYPEGLSGKEIPEAARIIAVAEAYVEMTRKTRTRDPLPSAFVREELIKESEGKYDPEIADIMVKIMDSLENEGLGLDDVTVETQITCGKYRDNITKGIEITNNVSKISFNYSPTDIKGDGFSAPSIILFDSFDRRVHSNEKAIKAYKYLEYGELWFDGHSIRTGAKNMEVSVDEHVETDERLIDRMKNKKQAYSIVASRYEDHIKLILESRDHTVEVVAALPSVSVSAYIGLTGENCNISGIRIEQTGEMTREEDIPRIASSDVYTDRLESDIPNIQIDRPRNVSTIGTPVKDGMMLRFHSMSLPSATLVWHCPYVVLFSSDDNTVGGSNYREYAMIKINGESNIENDFAENRFIMKRKESFPGWEEWKRINREGIECKVVFRKKGNRYSIITENLGISLENITTVNDASGEICAALTGDQVALTDIRIS
ncbi:MAG: HD domain-containing protein [Lachnospiraceae bacterium]|nr:HD domain-containing protein [Lachnospiraceae bacterium]